MRKISLVLILLLVAVGTSWLWPGLKTGLLNAQTPQHATIEGPSVTATEIGNPVVACQLDFIDPARDAQPEQSIAATTGLDLRFTFSANGSVNAAIEGDYLFWHWRDRVKAQIDDRQIVFESRLKFESLDDAGVAQFSPAQMASFLLFAEAGESLDLWLGDQYRNFSLIESRPAIARLKACIRKKLRGQTASIASQSPPLPVPPVRKLADSDADIPPFDNGRIKGVYRATGNAAFKRACEITLSNPPGLRADLNKYSLAIALDDEGFLIFSLRSNEGPYPNASALMATIRLGDKSYLGQLSGRSEGSFRIRGGAEAQEMWASAIQARQVEVTTLSSTYSKDTIDIPDWSDARQWLVDCARRKLSLFSVSRTFIDGQPMSVDAYQYAGTLWRAALLDSAGGAYPGIVDRLYAAPQTGFLSHSFSGTGNTLAGVTRIVEGSDLAAETARAFETLTAVCPSKPVPAIELPPRRGSFRQIATGYLDCRTGSDFRAFMIVGVARDAGGLVWSAAAASGSGDVQFAARRLFGDLVAVAPEIATP